MKNNLWKSNWYWVEQTKLMFRSDGQISVLMDGIMNKNGLRA